MRKSFLLRVIGLESSEPSGGLVDKDHARGEMRETLARHRPVLTADERAEIDRKAAVLVQRWKDGAAEAPAFEV